MYSIFISSSITVGSDNGIIVDNLKTIFYKFSCITTKKRFHKVMVFEILFYSKRHHYMMLERWSMLLNSTLPISGIRKMFY